MGLINNLSLYPIKEVPTSSDFVIGTDAADNNKTVNFRVSALTGSSGLQNNRYKRLNFGAAFSADSSQPSIAAKINAFTNLVTPDLYVVEEDEVPMFVGYVITGNGTMATLNKYVLEGSGKGTYGAGGTVTVTDNKLILVYSEVIFESPDVTDDPNAHLESLGEIGAADFLDIINAADPKYVIEAGTNWYFDFTVSGSRKLYGFRGSNGDYGLGQTPMDSSDVFLIFDESTNTGVAGDLQQTTDLGNITKNDMIISAGDSINAKNGLYISRPSEPNQRAFIGTIQKAAGTHVGVIELSSEQAFVASIGTDGIYTADRTFTLPDENGGLIVDAPSNANSYLRYQNAWVVATLSGTGLEAVDEGSSFNDGIGYRIVGKDPTFYGDIGGFATDLSENPVISATHGATGNWSFAANRETTASGNQSVALNSRTVASGTNSFAAGTDTIASGSGSTAFGNIATASGFTSFATGYLTDASGYYTSVFGKGSTAYSAFESVFGTYNTGYTPISTSVFNSADRLFVIGNGVNSGSKSDIFTILKGGVIGIGVNNFEAFNTGELLQVKGSVKASTIKLTTLLAFADDTAAGVGGLLAGDVYTTATGEVRIKL